jgi:hypothetical protein
VVTLVWSDEVGPNGGFEVYAHRALPFGALSSVTLYTTISQGVCMILRRLFALGQQAYVDDFLRVPPEKWAVIQEIAFRRVHRILGIPLKVGKEDLGRCLQALGHEIAATALWAGLRMTDKRREAVLLKISHSLAHGFKELEIQVLAGHLDFALLATAGKASRAFAHTIYDAKEGPSEKQPPAVYRALQWLEAILQKPPRGLKGPTTLTITSCCQMVTGTQKQWKEEWEQCCCEKVVTLSRMGV